MLTRNAWKLPQSRIHWPATAATPDQKGCQAWTDFACPSLPAQWYGLSSRWHHDASAYRMHKYHGRYAVRSLSASHTHDLSHPSYFRFVSNSCINRSLMTLSITPSCNSTENLSPKFQHQLHLQPLRKVLCNSSAQKPVSQGRTSMEALLKPKHYRSSLQFKGSSQVLQIQFPSTCGSKNPYP